ncbi:hypothetical protein C8J57DRAFT_1481016 [Mycena rebaudengoi]|nr:hypothetical protein C8J57DRAFT_1481016 [Mycena rebaudengoi]
MYMRPRSTPSPLGSVYPQNDVATYRDLLLFEERLKTTAASLQRRKSRYQLFLLQLLAVIVFLLAEVLLPPHVSLIAIPCKVVLQCVLPSVYTADTPVHIHPYVSSGLLFVSVTTLALFFASGTYTDKIAYANKYVPHANRALRSFNMYLNVRKPPLRTKLLSNPLAFFFPRPDDPPPSPSPPSRSSSRAPSSSSSSSPMQIGSTSTSLPIPPIPPAANPRGELRLSSRVDRAFRDGYERYRANFERKRAAQAQQQHEQARAQSASPSTTVSRDGTPPVGSMRGMRERERERVSSTHERERSGTPPALRPTIAERRSITPTLVPDRGSSLGSGSVRRDSGGSGGGAGGGWWQFATPSLTKRLGTAGGQGTLTLDSLRDEIVVEKAYRNVTRTAYREMGAGRAFRDQGVEGAPRDHR